MGKSIHRWSDEEKEYLKEITPGRHHKEITDLMNEKFEYKFEVKQIKNAIDYINCIFYLNLYCSFNLTRSKASCTNVNSFWRSVN